jgi:AbiV family abortive infection protein
MPRRVPSRYGFVTMGNRVLKFLEVEALYDATLSNAFYLTQDANVLLEKGSTGRAHALAILALEECGKAILIHNAKVASHNRQLPDPELDDTFWQSWRTHQPKLRAVREFLIQNRYWFDYQPPEPDELLLGSVEDYLAELDRFAKEGDSSKQRGLYVGVDPATGKPVSPLDESGLDEVVEILRMAHQIGWQLRLGDHIEFVTTERSTGAPMSLYARYADGGDLAHSLGDRGWEAQEVELVLTMRSFGPESPDDQVTTQDGHGR